MPATQTNASVESGDVSLFVRKFGTRTGRLPLLILHGANYFDSADWVEVAERLGMDREVVAFDARGFGNSSWSASKDYGLAAALGDIRTVVRHAGWERAVLVGHSRGGAQALLAAARAPEIAAGLVLVDYNPGRGFGPPGGTVPSPAQLLPVFPTIEAALEATTRYRTAPLGADMQARALQFLKSVEGGVQLSKRDPYFLSQAADRDAALGLRGGHEELADTRCPVLIVRARRSSALDPADLARLRAIDRVEIREVDAGHDVAGEAPDAFAAELSQWLQAVESAAS